jgi:GNAT superfamily N-acetyltransferase
MQYEIVATNTPTAADRDGILALLNAYNESRAGPSRFWPLALLLRDPASGKTVGGLSARSMYDWLYVDLLAVPEPLRRQGVGSRLMRRAEAVAGERGCVGVWVDTYGFQARGFYEKLGYEIFGTIDDHPCGSQRFFFRKRLARP